jgi:hypothetical protein
MQGAREVVAEEQDEEATPWMPLLRIEWTQQGEEATIEAPMAAFPACRGSLGASVCNNQSSDERTADAFVRTGTGCRAHAESRWRATLASQC